MEVRVENVILNVDMQGSVEDLSFLRGVCNLVVTYYKANKKMKTTIAAMFVMVCMELIHLSIIQHLKNAREEEQR